MITEMDGPPNAYFEVTDGKHVVRRVYRTLRTSSYEKLQDDVDKIRAELLRITSSQGFPMIFWRARPTVDIEKGYARLTTSPPLSDEFWGTVGWDQGGTGYSEP